MKIEVKKLESELEKEVYKIINKVETLLKLSTLELNKKPNPESWSALECIAHLNLYSDFYHAAIWASLNNNNSYPQPFFKTGVLGNYFVKSMMPKERVNKMKTFKDKNPIGNILNPSDLAKFIDYQKDFLRIIKESKKVNLISTKTKVSFSTLFKMRLGDTLRFMLAHNLRHLDQAEKAVLS